jgi:hypothetical protein
VSVPSVQFSQHFFGFLFDYGALEEILVHPAVKLDRIR